MKRVLHLRPPGQRALAAVALILGIAFLSPWPGPQALLHVTLVLGFALDPASPLLTAVWAAAGGWALEGTLRIYPHLGGTPWADMSVALLARFLLLEWPVDSLKGWVGRQALLGAIWILLIHFMVWLAAGPHLWGGAWFWVVLGLPAWAWVSWRWQRPGAR